jgi:hypothetical protein
MMEAHGQRAIFSVGPDLIGPTRTRGTIEGNNDNARFEERQGRRGRCGATGSF